MRVLPLALPLPPCPCHRDPPRCSLELPLRSQQTQRQAAAAAAKKPPELEYAKSYVSKIRKRFKHSPKTYQQFLNILQVTHIPTRR
jgi:histone deacetylase complex regulatory component SIN3